MNTSRYRLIATAVALFTAALLTIAVPLAQSDASSLEAISIDDIRLGQPILPGLPVVLWQGDSLMVSVPGGVEPLDASDLSERLVQLHEDEVFESHWREFVGAVAGAAQPLGTTPAMLRRFNLETLPNMLLARPELIHALLTGEAPREAAPYGNKVCFERTYGMRQHHCELEIWGICLDDVTDGCDTSVEQAWSCHVDKYIVCPTAVNFLTPRFD